MALTSHLKNKLRVALADKSARDELIALLQQLSGEANQTIPSGYTLTINGTLDSNGNASFSGNMTAKRLHLNEGNALAAGNISLGSGFGDSANVTVDSGSTDSRFSGNITVGTANTTANATFNFTFRDGAFLNAPRAIITLNGLSATGNVRVTPSTTGLACVYQATPVANQTIGFTGIVIG